MNIIIVDNIIFALNQALLGRLTNDLLCISFDYHEHHVNVQILCETGGVEFKCLVHDFKKEVEQLLPGFTFKFKELELDRQDYNNFNFERLKWASFLRY